MNTSMKVGLAIGFGIALAWGIVHIAKAHEHKPGETSEQQQVIEWLRTWKRPSGNFIGMQHRVSSCCYISGSMQDCFPVAETRVSKDGHIWVRPDTSDAPVPGAYTDWYDTSQHHVSEIEQPDPRESPDGRSYVCIAGTEVVCYVPGYGG